MRHKSPPKIAKHTAKDSVFTDLFKKLPFLLQMYQALHPEDNTASEEDLKIITIQNILVNQMYNDLGFLVRDRLIILVECQSIWAINIVLRLFLYYHRFLLLPLVYELFLSLLFFHCLFLLFVVRFLLSFFQLVLQALLVLLL